MRARSCHWSTAGSHSSCEESCEISRGLSELQKKKINKLGSTNVEKQNIKVAISERWSLFRGNLK